MSGDDIDILARLTDAYESLCDIGGAWERDVVRDAADVIEARDAKIERLLAEVDRLRAVGDALAESLEHSRADIRAAAHAWQEARRG